MLSNKEQKSMVTLKSIEKKLEKKPEGLTAYRKREENKFIIVLFHNPYETDKILAVNSNDKTFCTDKYGWQSQAELKHYRWRLPK
jgi:hypothetical protein